MELKHLLLVAGMAAATTAGATQINGSGLKNGLDASTQDGDFSYNMLTDQYNPDETWTLDAVSSGNAVMMFEYAGFASSNTMGIYDLNTGAQLELFNGAASTGDQVLLSQTGFTFTATYFDENDVFQGQSSTGLTSSNFGFYLTTPNNTFYSQASLNGDSDADGIEDDHMVAYRGDGSENMDPDGDGLYGIFDTQNFILAWEDLVLSGSDRDYADMVVMVESFVPVPEPGTLALLGLGLAGLGAARRRQKA